MRPVRFGQLRAPLARLPLRLTRQTRQTRRVCSTCTRFVPFQKATTSLCFPSRESSSDSPRETLHQPFESQRIAEVAPEPSHKTFKKSEVLRMKLRPSAALHMPYHRVSRRMFHPTSSPVICLSGSLHQRFSLETENEPHDLTSPVSTPFTLPIVSLAHFSG